MITQFNALGISKHSRKSEATGTDDVGSDLFDDAIRVEAVDTNHPAWGEVMQSIFRAGDGPAMLVHEHGRLSSRQTVLAALAGDEVVGHLCFRVEPTRCAVGRVAVRAKLDSFAVGDGHIGAAVADLLFKTADQRARLMNCRGPRARANALC